jgi:hypothetical protein
MWLFTAFVTPSLGTGIIRLITNIKKVVTVLKRKDVENTQPEEDDEAVKLELEECGKERLRQQM